jgi:hypothetical protein
MALSFLYLAFTRILQLVRLRQRDRDELAIEVGVWVPRMSSGYLDQGLPRMAGEDETGPLPSRSSSSHSPTSSS